MRRVALAVTVVAFLVVYSAQAGWCAKTWDAGAAIDGDLDANVIEVAASSSIDGDSTGTKMWTGADMDHYIDEGESVPDDEGSESDYFGSFSDTKCWWTATDGDVTNSSLITTWTAPHEEGVAANIEIGVVDLPKSIGGGEAGTRDDAGREYFGAQEANAVGYWITWAGPVVSGSTSHSFTFATPHVGGGGTLGLVDPDAPDCDGFYKKMELRGNLAPSRANVVFELRHEKKRFTTLNSEDFGTQYPNWTNDQTSHNGTSCAQHQRVYVWDCPGMKCTGGEWAKDPSDIMLVSQWHFRDRARYNGRVASDWSTTYSRRIELHGQIGNTTWDKTMPPRVNN